MGMALHLQKKEGSLPHGDDNLYTKSSTTVISYKNGSGIQWNLFQKARNSHRVFMTV